MMNRFVSSIAMLAFACWPAHGQSACQSADQPKACCATAPPRPTPSNQSVEAKPATLELLIEGMSCDRCAASISEALDDLEGVRRAEISFSSAGGGRGVVAYNAALTDAARIIEAVRGVKHMNVEGAFTAKRDLSSDRVSLFEVPLVCLAAPEIGCGPVAKPILSALESQPGVAEAWLNRAGTILAIVWTEDASQEQRDGSLRVLTAELAKRDQTQGVKPTEVAGSQRDAKVEEFLRLARSWYRDTAINSLSEHEAETIANRLARRVQIAVALDDAKTTAVAQALTATFRAHITDDLPAVMEWVETQMNEELVQAVRPHLDDKGVAALRKALEAGIRPLPSDNEAAAAASWRLEPWEPIDEAYRLCEGGCGKRVGSASPDVKNQPGVRLGQKTYCPVSGVVFQVSQTSLQRTIDGRTIYFCCSGCAAYFDANRDQVSARRGFAGTTGNAK